MATCGDCKYFTKKWVDPDNQSRGYHPVCHYDPKRRFREEDDPVCHLFDEAADDSFRKNKSK